MNKPHNLLSSEIVECSKKKLSDYERMYSDMKDVYVTMDNSLTYRIMKHFQLSHVKDRNRNRNANAEELDRLEDTIIHQTERFAAKYLPIYKKKLFISPDAELHIYMPLAFDILDMKNMANGDFGVFQNATAIYKDGKYEGMKHPTFHWAHTFLDAFPGNTINHLDSLSVITGNSNCPWNNALLCWVGSDFVYNFLHKPIHRMLGNGTENEDEEEEVEKKKSYDVYAIRHGVQKQPKLCGYYGLQGLEWYVKDAWDMYKIATSENYNDKYITNHFVQKCNTCILKNAK